MPTCTDRSVGGIGFDGDGCLDYIPGSRVGEQVVRIQVRDRLHHLDVIGRTGAGKSTLLGNLIQQDIASCEGCALFDPHGDLVERVASAFRRERPDDLFYLDVPGSEEVVFDPFADVSVERHPLVAAGLAARGVTRFAGA